MTLEIVSFRAEHLEDAATLMTARYRALRAEVPLLPARYELVSVILPMMEPLSSSAPGVAALADGRLVGFLLGMHIGPFRGKRAVYSPEWANGAVPENSRRIYSEMYSRLSARWVANGCFMHLVSMLAHDREGIEGWHWLGFGLGAVDGVRSLSPVPGESAQVEICRAGVEQVELLLNLEEGLWRHLAAPPTFMALMTRRGRRWAEELLADPSYAVWLAYQDGETVAYMLQGPASGDACTIIVDPGTTSITGAFTRPEARGSGIGTALLNRVLEWGCESGYERCCVDCEPENVLGLRFWLRSFQPVCFGLTRYVDERLAWAHADRAGHEIW